MNLTLLVMGWRIPLATETHWDIWNDNEGDGGLSAILVPTELVLVHVEEMILDTEDATWSRVGWRPR